MSSIIHWLKSLFCPTPEISSWFFIEFDEQCVYVKANPPYKKPWAYQFEWSDIRRVCFEDGNLSQSDCLYIWVKNQENSYMIPTEASGGSGSELFIALNEKGFFPDELMKQASLSTNGGLYCYPDLDKE